MADGLWPMTLADGGDGRYDDTAGMRGRQVNRTMTPLACGVDK